MSHEIAKRRLEQAGTFRQRTEAVKMALGLGMPLWQIEEYLDALDATEPRLKSAEVPCGPTLVRSPRTVVSTPAH